MSQEPDRIFYIGPNVIELCVLRKAEKLVGEGKTVHVHYHRKNQAECTERCMIWSPEDE